MFNYYKYGMFLEKNCNMVIVEWKVDGGRVDYVLFIGLKFVGFIEVKVEKKIIFGVLES